MRLRDQTPLHGLKTISDKGLGSESSRHVFGFCQNLATLTTLTEIWSTLYISDKVPDILCSAIIMLLISVGVAVVLSLGSTLPFWWKWLATFVTMPVLSRFADNGRP